MSLQVLSLNDAGVTLADASGLRHVSPACVLELDGRTLFGSEAAAQSRLYPLQSNNAFWYRLGMEPLTRPLAHFRHHADMVHAHLLHLAEQADAEGEVLLAIPGSYSREQLGVLLGVLQHSPFRAAGLVDLATVAAAASAALPAPQVIHLDLQLHQMVCTGLRREQGRLQREQVSALPDLGWTSLSNSLLQLVTDAFIRQCRFNPQHSASWEQQLHNALPQWLAPTDDAESDLIIELDTGATQYRARLTRDAFASRLQAYYKRLPEVLQALAGGQSACVVLSERCAALPGLSGWLAQHLPPGMQLLARPLTEREVHNTVLAYGETLRGNGQPALVKSLQLLAAAAADSAPAAPSPSAASLQLLPDGRLRLQCAQPGVLVNGQPVNGEVILSAGDRLSTAASEVSVQYG